MSLCTSIDTISMAYLDDELAGEERRELELHILDCAACRAHVESERADLAMLRGNLVAPPAPDLLHARVARMLDAEDKKVASEQRHRRWSSYALPAGAAAVGVLALVSFLAIQPGSGTRRVDPVENEVVRQHKRSMPLEVQGVSTQPWLQHHFMADLEVPQFQSGVRLVGARLTAVEGHDAALLMYEATDQGARFGLSALVIRDIHDGELTGGTEVQVGNRSLRVTDDDGVSTVTYVAPGGMGYAFLSDRVTPDELLHLVVQTNLIGRLQQGR